MKDLERQVRLTISKSMVFNLEYLTCKDICTFRPRRNLYICKNNAPLYRMNIYESCLLMMNVLSYTLTTASSA